MVEKGHKANLGSLNSIVIFMAVILISCLSFPSAGYSGTQSLTLKRPLNSNVNSRFGWRKAENTDGNVGYDRLHAGTDYRARTPTPVPYEGNYQTCRNGIATIANQCGISQRFIHLKHCEPGNLISGSTGTKHPHLHHELLINGTPVDGEHYFQGNCGSDLCTEQVRKCLLDHAKTKGGSGGSAGDRASSNSPAPDAKGGSGSGGSTGGGGASSSQLVERGQPDPVTGVVNQGGDYYVNTGEDGRVFREADPDDDSADAYPALGETTTQVTQNVDTNNEVTGCATDTWTAMTNMSVLQVRREMMINETFVAKPDTILAYACTNDILKSAGENLGIFSESKLWVNRQIDIIGKTVTVNKELGDTSLDGAVFRAANRAYMDYGKGNFNHGILGGTQSQGGGGGEGGGEDGNAQDNLPCGIMNQVWKAAKCKNFETEPGFPKFTDLIENASDPRKYPSNMKCNNTGIKQEMIDIAKGRDVKFDKVTSYLNMLKPDSGCYQQGLKTGVTVVVFEGSDRVTQQQSYADGVCISPGCSYQRSGQCE